MTVFLVVLAVLVLAGIVCTVLEWGSDRRFAPPPGSGQGRHGVDGQGWPFVDGPGPFIRLH